MKYNPNEFSKRHELLSILQERGISIEKTLEIIAPMSGCSQAKKEQIAAELIPIVQSGIYDCSPKHFYKKGDWYNEIQKLLSTNTLSYTTVRPVVEQILRYCSISNDSIECIFSLLRTEEHMRQMYNWLMDQSYVPDEAACINKAQEIDNSIPG